MKSFSKLLLPIILSGCYSVFPAAPIVVDSVNGSTISEAIKKDVETLSQTIGERNCYRPSNLNRAQKYIEDRFQEAGFAVVRQPVLYDLQHFQCEDTALFNLWIEKKGTDKPDEIIVVGAHYDSKVATKGWHDHGPPLAKEKGTPGANDNASGIGVLLSLATLIQNNTFERTVRLVAFVNEEPPFFQDETAMGSMVFVREAQRIHDHILGAVILDAVGTYNKNEGLKRRDYFGLPSLIGLNSNTNYIAFLSNWGSSDFAKESAKHFENFPLEVRASYFPAIHRSVAWSDDWSFWQHDIPAFTITDTAFLRSDSYHEVTDTPEKLDYDLLSNVTKSLFSLVHHFTHSTTIVR